ncbi:hypothetical protein BpHYR1_015696 [Brachionus plicatilis]|uniref:Uncharacterized protein n=1 Tax=Brachionus plicatilis TaxID=10195 RepID=A0A3M7RFX0_BRAPC|nr:hypothetical protein BpHYR1_015696 [Brachionus plicatilis]
MKKYFYYVFFYPTLQLPIHHLVFLQLLFEITTDDRSNFNFLGSFILSIKNVFILNILNYTKLKWLRFISWSYGSVVKY